MAHIRKILVPSDGSPPSLAALREAATLAGDLGASIDVLEVHDPSAPMSAPTERTERDAGSARHLDEAVASAKKTLGERVTRRTERGDPLHTILQVAGAGGYDLIVMGTHGRIGRLHAMLGSVAEAVVRNAPCLVLTVRGPTTSEGESFSEHRHGRGSIAEETRR